MSRKAKKKPVKKPVVQPPTGPVGPEPVAYASETEVVRDIEPIAQLTRDLRNAARTLSTEEARYLVDEYYTIQKDRIRAGNRVLAMTQTRAEAGQKHEPHEVIAWLGENTGRLERMIHSALDAYSDSQREGRWARLQIGVGPVIAAGLLAHIQLSETSFTNPSKIYRFAGLDPTVVWKKGQKRPWNARLKRLCWILGESFKKTSGHPDSVYGPLYRERKALEVQRNEAGLFAATAEQTLRDRKIEDAETLKAYRAGKLPAGRLDLRATRWAVKHFLTDYWRVCYMVKFGKTPPNPWVIEHGGHTDLRPVPGWPCD